MVTRVNYHNLSQSLVVTTVMYRSLTLQAPGEQGGDKCGPFHPDFQSSQPIFILSTLEERYHSRKLRNYPMLTCNINENQINTPNINTELIF